MADDSERVLARERSHSDARASNDLFRAAEQAAILINGGAATAVLAFTAKNSQWPMGLAVGIIIYAAGVMIAALAIFSSAQSAQKYMESWERVARSQSGDKQLADKGNKWHKCAVSSFFVSVGCFAFASVACAVSLLGTR